MLFDLIEASFNGRPKVEKGIKDVARGWLVHECRLAYVFC